MKLIIKNRLVIFITLMCLALISCNEKQTGKVVVGDQEFSFRDVAFMYNKVPEKPVALPGSLEIKIMSFETVDN